MRILGNKAIVHLPPNKTDSGIIIPDSAKDDTKAAWKRGVVVALGVAVKPECSVKVGDAVLFQFGFDVLDKKALLDLSGDEALDVEGELWIGNPESLFAVVDKDMGKKKPPKKPKPPYKK